MISQRGMGAALKLGAGGRNLAAGNDFLRAKQYRKRLDPKLIEKIRNPLIFKGPTDALGNDPLGAQVYGYDVTILIDKICKAIVKSRI